MSEETQGTTQEERFLGVRTTIEPPEPAAEGNTAEDLQIEVVDDRPQEDQRATSQEKKSGYKERQTTCSTWFAQKR